MKRILFVLLLLLAGCEKERYAQKDSPADRLYQVKIATMVR